MASASVTGNDDELIAASVRRFRESTGLSQADLADQMTRRGFSYHQSTVFKIETGDRKVSASELRGLAEVFQVPIDAFFGTDSRPSMSVVIRSRERAERLQIIAVDMVRLSRQAMVEQGNLEDDLDTYESMVEQTELTTGEHDALARGLLQWRELATWRGFKAFFEDYYSDEFAKWRMYDEFKSERRPNG